MQYTIAETASLNVIASINCKLKIEKNGEYITVSSEIAGTDLGTSDGVTREIISEVSGKITALSIYSTWAGNVWVDLAKVYFTNDFGDGYKYSVKGSANYQPDDSKIPPTAKPKIDPTQPKSTDKTNIDTLQKAKDLYETVTGQKFPSDSASTESINTAIDLYEKITGLKFPAKKQVVDSKPDPTVSTGTDWAKILKWGLIGGAILALVLGIIYFVNNSSKQEEKEIINVASPQTDVPTLSGSLPQTSKTLPKLGITRVKES